MQKKLSWILHNFEFFKLEIQMMIVLAAQLLQCGYLQDLTEELLKQMKQREHLIFH